MPGPRPTRREMEEWEGPEPAHLGRARRWVVIVIILSAVAVLAAFWSQAPSSRWGFRLPVCYGLALVWPCVTVELAGSFRRTPRQSIWSAMRWWAAACLGLGLFLFAGAGALTDMPSSLARGVALAAGSLQAGALVWLSILVRNRQDDPVGDRCRQCGYPLDALPTLPGARATSNIKQCPECGWVEIPETRGRGEAEGPVEASIK